MLYNKLYARGIEKWPIYIYNTPSDIRLDFDKIVPEPDVLKKHHVFSGSCGDALWYLSCHGRHILDESMINLLRQIFPKQYLDQESCKNMLQDLSLCVQDDLDFDIRMYMSGRNIISCFSQTGYPDELSWRLRKWGPSAPAKCTSITKGTVSFCTDGGIPDPIAQALSRQHPDIVIRHVCGNGKHNVCTLWENGYTMSADQTVL